MRWLVWGGRRAAGGAGLVGNLLVARSVGAQVRLVSVADYRRLGSEVPPSPLPLPTNTPTRAGRAAGACACHECVCACVCVWGGGAQALLEKLAAELRAGGRRPYVIPVGGSNALGARACACLHVRGGGTCTIERRAFTRRNMGVPDVRGGASLAGRV